MFTKHTLPISDLLTLTTTTTKNQYTLAWKSVAEALFTNMDSGLCAGTYAHILCIPFVVCESFLTGVETVLMQLWIWGVPILPGVSAPPSPTLREHCSSPLPHTPHTVTPAPLKGKGIVCGSCYGNSIGWRSMELSYHMTTGHFWIDVEQQVWYGTHYVCGRCHLHTHSSNEG